MRILTALMTALLAAGAARSAEKKEPAPVKLVHTGDVFGKGGDWDRQYAREALQIFNGLKPDPAWEAKLRALPDNTWLRCNPGGPQKPESGRSEVPMVYAANVEACIFTCGCTSPGYSSDTWAYKTGANRWVQMWPNWVKGSAAKRLNKGPYPTDRPAGRCSLGLAYDSDRKRVVLHGGANAGKGGRVTWDYDPANNTWHQSAPGGAGPARGEDNCVGFAPGFGVVEVLGGRKTKAASTWVFRPAEKKWVRLVAKGAPPGAHNSRLVWAAAHKKLVFWSHQDDTLWTFDPAALAWEDVTPGEGEKPVGFYRQGMAYDTANDVVVMYGTKDGRNNSRGPWVYDLKTRKWKDMKPAGGPGRKGQQLPMCYDSRYNVMVMASSSVRGTWVYRYKRAPARGK
ncbi:MAG: Kelch repeat-containing protein [Planctomycetota bacterium]|jgi:hypothetical protein